MNEYKFIKKRDLNNDYDTTNVEITCHTSSRSDLLDAFQEFIFACGFRFKGELEFVEDDYDNED